MALSYILDSWPVLEWLQNREPVASRLRALIQQVAQQNGTLEMSRINHGEVIYMVRKTPAIRDPQAALEAFYSLPLVLHSVDDALISEAVDLKSVYSISYADAFAAAQAVRRRIPLVTGDREFRALESDGALELYWLGA